MILPLEEGLAFTPEHSEDLLKLDEALDRLSKLDPRQSRIVELRFFGGLSVEETSQVSERLPDHGQAGLGCGESLAVRRIEARPWR